MSRSRRILWSIAVVALAAVACGPAAEEGDQTAAGAAPEEVEPATQPAAEPPATAAATLTGREGTEISGTVTFTETAGGVEIVAVVQGVAGEASLHGFHVHETGDCSAPDFTSAGGHFNPTGVEHGGPASAIHHAGDLGNMLIGVDGSGTLTLTSSMLTVGAGPNSVVGRAVILHAGTDDLVSQPTGDAGGRLACGVVAAQ